MDGTVERAPDDACTPFAVVVPFTADVTIAHLHAITADRTRGGHVLHARVGPGVLRIAAVSDLHLELPPGVELPAGGLDADRAAALDRLENG